MSDIIAKSKTSEDIQYKHSYLTEVIARLDFLSPINSLAEKLPARIARKAKDHFPIAEPQDLIGKELQISADEFRSRDVRAKEWQFHGKQREKTLAIGQAALYVKYTKYNSYENLRNEFLDILNVSFDSFPDLQGMRLGLRYINTIDVPGSDPLSWNDYINPNMLGVLNFTPNSTYISRIFHILEYNYGDFNLRFQFGIPNPDYPAQIKRRGFVLDIDAYYQGIQEKNDITTNLDMFHTKIQELFELSITDNLRKTMNE